MAEFRRKHPTDARQFTYIYPVAGDMYRMMFETKSSAVIGIGSSLKERWSDVEGLDAYASLILKNEENAQRVWSEHLKELRSLGILCEFEKADRARIERGLLVLKDGDIVKMDSWLTEPRDAESHPNPQK